MWNILKAIQDKASQLKHDYIDVVMEPRIVFIEDIQHLALKKLLNDMNAKGATYGHALMEECSANPGNKSVLAFAATNIIDDIWSIDKGVDLQDQNQLYKKIAAFLEVVSVARRGGVVYKGEERYEKHLITALTISIEQHIRSKPANSFVENFDKQMHRMTIGEFFKPLISHYSFDEDSIAVTLNNHSLTQNADGHWILKTEKGQVASFVTKFPDDEHITFEAVVSGEYSDIDLQ